jgi:hypothetical protein
MINQLALTDDVEGLWSVESRNPSSAKAFLHDQDPEQTFSSQRAGGFHLGFGLENFRFLAR